MTETHLSVKGHRDFNRLWTGRAASQFGSDIGAVALPLIAVEIVGASTLQIALLAALTSVTVAALAFPVGTHVEFRRKRPVMIFADVARFICLLSIPVAAWIGVLGFAQLCVVAVVNAACQIAFSSASQAHLKALVSADRLMDAHGRLESTTWLSVTVGRSAGGVLVAAFTALGALAIDALSFVVSALTVWRIRTPEPEPPVPDVEASKREQLWGGWHFVRRDSTLRTMLISWITFAGASGMAFPVSTVFYLRDLGFSAFEYGLLMGIPSIGGFLGARLVRPAVSRFGSVRTLWWASMLRGPWYFLIPLAWPGTGGLILCGIGFGCQLFFASMANSTMNGYRQLRTPDHLQSRVSTLWSFATTVSQPVFMVGGGLLATAVGTRPALFAAAGLMAVAAFLLPAAGRPVAAA